MVRPPIRVSESPGPGDPDPVDVEPGTAAVCLRPLTAADLPLLGRWLAAPHVHRWWHHQTDEAAVERDFGPALRDEEPGEDLMVLLESDGRTRPVGLVQRCRWHDYPEYVDEIAPSVDIPVGATTIDYLIGPVELTGHGLGPRIIAAAVAENWRRYPESTCVIVPVHADNQASWRVLEKAGFRRIGTADLEPDNPADDRRHVVYRYDRPTGSPSGPSGSGVAP